MQTGNLHKKIALSCLTFVIGFGLCYTSSLLYRSWRLYDHLRHHARGFDGQLYGPDPVLGFAPIPNSRGYEIVRTGPEIPVRFDQYGFRIAAEGEGARHRPLVLALGCSFTHGTACAAGETYPFKLARLLHGSELNAGGCGYSLAQMLILAERLIAEWKPDYVVVQYSPWLVDRALSQFAPVYFGLKPVPYFADGDDGSIRLRPPVFSTAAFRVDGSVYRKQRPTRKQFWSFAAKIGTPLLVHDDWSRLAYRCQSMTGLVDRPTRRRGEALKHVYGRIQTLCAEHHSSLIVVVLGSGAKPVPIPSELAGLDLCVVDAHSALIGRLDAPSAFETTYETFRRGRDVYREGHPNPQAHSIIAEMLASRIAEMRAGKTGSR